MCLGAYRYLYMSVDVCCACPVSLTLTLTLTLTLSITLTCCACSASLTHDAPPPPTNQVDPSQREDPREALLKLDAATKADPMFLGRAYAHTQVE